jgi:CBS domain containing-hemolysin-like protein
VLIALANIGLGVLVVVLITAFTAYFVAQEFAYTTVSRAGLTAQAEAGDRSAARALEVTRRTSFMLSGAQLGITVTGLLAGYLAEPLIGTGLADLLGIASVPTAVGVAIGAAVSLIFCTFVQMLFGELFPKNLAIAVPESVARRLAVSTRWYLRLFGWLIWFMDQSSNMLLRAVRIEPVHDVEQAATARDLEHIVAASFASGELPADLSTLLDRVLDFPTSTARGWTPSASMSPSIRCSPGWRQATPVTRSSARPPTRCSACSTCTRCSPRNRRRPRTLCAALPCRCRRRCRCRKR